MPEPQRRRPRQRSIPARWRLMKMLTEGNWRTASGGSTIRNYSNATARRLIGFMLHRMSPLLAQSGHFASEFQYPLMTQADIGFLELLLRKVDVEPHFTDRGFLFESGLT